MADDRVDQEPGNEDASAGPEEPVFDHVRNRIRSLRQSQPISQTRLAQHLGVTPNTVSRWETGTYRPDLSDVARMARFFGVPVSEFFPEGEAEGGHLAGLLGAVRDLPPSEIAELRRLAEERRKALRPGEDEGEPGNEPAGQ